MDISDRIEGFGLYEGLYYLSGYDYYFSLGDGCAPPNKVFPSDEWGTLIFGNEDDYGANAGIGAIGYGISYSNISGELITPTQITFHNTDIHYARIIYADGTFSALIPSVNGSCTLFIEKPLYCFLLYDENNGYYYDFTYESVTEDVVTTVWTNYVNTIEQEVGT